MRICTLKSDRFSPRPPLNVAWKTEQRRPILPGQSGHQENKFPVENSSNHVRGPTWDAFMDDTSRTAWSGGQGPVDGRGVSPASRREGEGKGEGKEEGKGRRRGGGKREERGRIEATKVGQHMVLGSFLSEPFNAITCHPALEEAAACHKARFLPAVGSGWCQSTNDIILSTPDARRPGSQPLNPAIHPSIHKYVKPLCMAMFGAMRLSWPWHRRSRQMLSARHLGALLKDGSSQLQKDSIREEGQHACI